jgi:D-alanyl-D-alanine carboxypeptidase (penicillin-binding protein 5/6)
MRVILGSLTALTLLNFPLHAQTPQPAAPTAGAVINPLLTDPLNTIAPYAVVMDGDSGQVLYGKRGDDPIIPASMSKLMLYYMVFERIRDGRIKLSDELPVSEHAWRTGGAGTDGSTMFLKLGSKVSVENLLKGAVIQSGNDACIALAEGLAGSEEAFAQEMTARAHELGMKTSRFANVTGLDHPDHRMSATDIARIGYLIIRDFPEFYPLFREKSFTWNGITQPNRNPLINEIEGADGIKTGHLSASGFGLVGSAVRDGQRRIIVLQGLSSEAERRREGARVMRAAFSEFQKTELVAKDVDVADAQVFLGVRATVPLVATETVTRAMHVSARKNVQAKVVYKGPLRAPIQKGQIVGDLIITAPGLPETRIPVAAAEDVAKANIFARALIGLRGS